MITKKTHIAKVKAGDTVLHLGKVKTLSQSAIKRGGFMGDSIWGDCYQCGSKPVIIILDLNKTTNNDPSNEPTCSASWRDLEVNEIPMAGDEAWNGELQCFETVTIPSMWLAGGHRIAGDRFRTKRVPNAQAMASADEKTPTKKTTL